MFGLGFGEIAIILVVALIVLGPSKLPEFAKGIGKGLREFRKATEDFKSTIDGELYKPEPPRPVNRAQVATPSATPIAVGATGVMAVGATDAVAVGATDAVAVGATDAVAVGATDAVAVPVTTEAVAVPTIDPTRRALAERSPLASPGVQPLASPAVVSSPAETSADGSAEAERALPATLKAAASGDKSSA